ncbi:hypothetical protein EDB89DRAFT_322459 [Lactarius sanguifluus]|nr:hypothetical protein EDB89DRAFT_322459 [Lactarius sanguifluus]
MSGISKISQRQTQQQLLPRSLAPAPPPMAHIGTRLSLTHPHGRPGHLPLAHPTVDGRHFPSIAAQRWQAGSGDQIPLLVYLWRLNGQLQMKHSGLQAGASIDRITSGPQGPSRVASFRKSIPILVRHPVICLMRQVIRFPLSLNLLLFILTADARMPATGMKMTKYLGVVWPVHITWHLPHVPPVTPGR